MDLLLIIFSLIFGAIFGSFLNVVIARLPYKKSIIFPASHCPKCGDKIKPYHNVPIFSYIFLKGRCFHCSEPISIRYLLVEVITALSFLCVVIANDFKIDLILFRNLIFFASGIAIIFIDFEHYIIPDVISLPLILVGLIFAFFTPAPGFLSALFGAIAGFILFYLVALFYVKVKKQDGLGGGDIKYIAGIGAFVGLGGMLFVMLFSSVIALITFIVMFLLGKGDLKRAIPYGPFLTIFAFLYLLLGERIIDYYLGFY